MKKINLSPKIFAYAVLLGLGIEIRTLPLLAEDKLNVALPSNVTISL